MSFKPVPVDSRGLARVPRERDCVGEQCPIAQKRGQCFIDWHHLYWPFEKFTSQSDRLKEFHDDRHNIVPMARCRHNSSLAISQHKKYDFALIPPIDTIDTFLDESKTLFQLGVTVKNMARIVRSLMTQNEKEKARCPERSIDWLHIFASDYYDLQKKVTNFDIVPAEVVLNAMNAHQHSIETVQESGIIIIDSALETV